METEIYSASTEVRERKEVVICGKVEAPPFFFFMAMSALQLAFFYSFAPKFSPYLEKGSRGSHEMINTYLEVKFTK